MKRHFTLIDCIVKLLKSECTYECINWFEMIYQAFSRLLSLLLLSMRGMRNASLALQRNSLGSCIHFKPMYRIAHSIHSSVCEEIETLNQFLWYFNSSRSWSHVYRKASTWTRSGASSLQQLNAWPLFTVSAFDKSNGSKNNEKNARRNTSKVWRFQSMRNMWAHGWLASSHFFFAIVPHGIPQYASEKSKNGISFGNIALLKKNNVKFISRRHHSPQNIIAVENLHEPKRSFYLIISSSNNEATVNFHFSGWKIAHNHQKYQIAGCTNWFHECSVPRNVLRANSATHKHYASSHRQAL